MLPGIWKTCFLIFISGIGATSSSITGSFTTISILGSLVKRSVIFADKSILKKYISENGKILPSRITNVSQKKQRELSLSIKRARNLALI